MGENSSERANEKIPVGLWTAAQFKEDTMHGNNGCFVLDSVLMGSGWISSFICWILLGISYLPDSRRHGTDKARNGKSDRQEGLS